MKRKRKTVDVDVAPVVTASPYTKDKVLKVCKENPNFYPPDKVAKTPNGSHRTTTPRRRTGEVTKTTIDYSATEQQPLNKVRRRLDVSFVAFFSDPSDDKKSCTDSLISLPTWTKTFGPVVITADDLKDTPNRKTVESQISVMGCSAKDAFDNFIKNFKGVLSEKDFDLINNNRPKTLNWCHIVAFCLAACVTNTQVEKDLTAGSWSCNSEMIPYEKGFRNRLLSEESFSKMEINGSAIIFQDSQVAKEIILNIKLTYPHSNTVEFSVSFDGLAVSRKPSAIANMLIEITDIFNEKKYYDSKEESENAMKQDEADKENQNPNSCRK